MKKRSIKKWAFIAIATIMVIAVVSILVVENAGRGVSSANAEDIVMVEKRSLSTGLSVTGTVESVDHKSLTSTLSNYKVLSVNVSVGDNVKAGDIIAIFETDDIERSISNAQESLSITNGQNSLSIQGADRDVQNAEITKEYQLASADQDVVTAEKSKADAQKDVDEIIIDLDEKKAEELEKEMIYSTARLEYDAVKVNYDKANNRYILAQTDFDAASAHKDLTSEGNWYVDALDELNQSKVVLNQFKGEYDINNKAYTEGKKEYDLAKSEREALETKLKTAEKTLENADNSLQTALRNKDNTLNTQNSQIQSKQESLQNTALNANNNTQTVKNQIEDNNKKLQEGIVKAPFDGIITEVSIEAGKVYTGGQIVKIEDCQAYILSAEIGEYDINDIIQSMDVNFKTEATGQDILNGKIDFISPTPVNNTTANAKVVYKVESSIDSSTEQLKLGMSAKMNIIYEQKEDVLTVPYEAVRQDDSGNSYIVVRSIIVDSENSEDREIVVEVGMESDYYIEIQSPEIQEGMQVVLPENDVSDKEK